MQESNPLIPLVQRFVDGDPRAAARALEGMDEPEAAEVVGALPPETTARIVPHLQIGYAAALVKDLPVENFRTVVRSLDAPQAASLFMRLPPDSRERLAPHTPKRMKAEIRDLLIYPEGSVGRLMVTSYLSFRGTERIGEAIKKIRKLAARGFPASYAYVVDEENHLVGVVNMRDLLLAPEDGLLEQVVNRNVFALDCFTDHAEAAEELSKRRYFAAPVVDSQNHILGIVKAEQLIHGVQEEAAESIQRMFGGSPDERAFSPLLFSLKRRLPWLHVNLATAFLAAFVVSLFEETIARITVLAIFLPVVAGQGGNAGAQSLAIVMRGLVMREVASNRVLKLVGKEALLGTLTGTITGIVTGAIAWLWQGNWALGVVIGLGMIVNLCAAGLAGAAIPVVMKRLGFDPAQCSSIILTTVTDVVGFLAFLGFAVLFQEQLV